MKTAQVLACAVAVFTGRLKESAIPTIHGNTTGLKPAETKMLERLYRRRMPPDAVITPEAARALSEASAAIGRQIGLIIDRSGSVRNVLVGTNKDILIPDLSEHRLGAKRLRGVRFIHTHLKGQPLNQEDLTDLALLRMDLIAALAVQADGLPGTISIAYLIPPNPEEKLYEVLLPQSVHALSLDISEFIADIERQMERAQAALEVAKKDRAILVSVSKKSRQEQEESVEELKELSRTDGITVLDAVIQRLHDINPKYLLGEGKLKELIIRSQQLGADLIVFDQNLSPAQIKAIGDITEMRVIDRTQLILDIFARRAHSGDGKVQVELAQLKYRLPRLSERSTALSRLTGGIGGRGPGETRLEVDMRRARDKIRRLEKQLDALGKARGQRRERRIKSDIPIVSIAGYTNAGKSTLFNALTRSEVKAENLLFATLDTATRRLRFPRDREVVITDTVGFIKDLPQDLLGAFRATLDEMQDADLILHVVDISNPRFEQQMESVNTLLQEIGLEHIPQLMVLNKVDLVNPLWAKAMASRFKGVACSAIKQDTFGDLLKEIEKRVWRDDSSEFKVHSS
ncbi:MAG: GTPase HflX [Nitrospiraceae bacterium]|nr:GTPase HflX [Nitrospiraceae bacterium]